MRDLKEIIQVSYHKILHSIALFFHRNSELTPLNMEAFAQQIGEYAASEEHPFEEEFYPYKTKIQLTKPRLPFFYRNLRKILFARRSQRQFANKNLSFSEVSSLLQLAYGKVPATPISFSTVPSAGALYPLHIYLVVLEGPVPPGIYHYFFRAPHLDVICEFSQKKTELDCIFSQGIEECTMYMVITAQIKETMSKYGDRGYRFIFIECGHLAQNILLTSTLLKIKTVPLGGFLDKELANLLMVDYQYEKPLYVIAIGK